MDLPNPPEPRLRPAFALWLWQRDIKIVDAGEVLSKHPEQLRRYVLPFDDKRRQLPPTEFIQLVDQWTRGACPPGSWYPPSPYSPPVTGEAPEALLYLRGDQ